MWPLIACCHHVDRSVCRPPLCFHNSTGSSTGSLDHQPLCADTCKAAILAASLDAVSPAAADVLQQQSSEAAQQPVLHRRPCWHGQRRPWLHNALLPEHRRTYMRRNPQSNCELCKAPPSQPHTPSCTQPSNSKASCNKDRHRLR